MEVKKQELLLTHKTIQLHLCITECLFKLKGSFISNLYRELNMKSYKFLNILYTKKGLFKYISKHCFCVTWLKFSDIIWLINERYLLVATKSWKHWFASRIRAFNASQSGTAHSSSVGALPQIKCTPLSLQHFHPTVSRY